MIGEPISSVPIAAFIDETEEATEQEATTQVENQLIKSAKRY